MKVLVWLYDRLSNLRLVAVNGFHISFLLLIWFRPENWLGKLFLTLLSFAMWVRRVHAMPAVPGRKFTVQKGGQS